MLVLDTEPWENFTKISFPSVGPSVQTESRKRKRKVEDDEQEERDSNSGGSAQRCPAKKHECHLYELYRSKWWVQCFYWNKSFKS